MTDIIANGNSADIFDYDEGRVLKLFHKEYILDVIKYEVKNTKYANEAGIPSPKCYGIIEKEGRIGILYDKVYGKEFFHTFTQEKENAYLKQMLISLHKQILACKGDKLRSYKDVLLFQAGGDWKLMRKIARLPDGDAFCHGDFHPANIVFGADKKPLVIDFLDACRAPKEYDIAVSYYILGYAKVRDSDKGKAPSDEIRRKLANEYLEGMGVGFPEIESFLKCIKNYDVESSMI